MTKWSQVRTKVEAKTDINLKTPKSAKHYKNQRNINSFGVRGDRFEDQHRSEIDQKTEPRWKCVLSPILVDVGSICGGFWELKLTSNRFEKPSKTRPRTKRGPRRPKGRFWVDDGDRPLQFGPRGGGRGRVNPPPGDIVYRERGLEGNGQR